MWALTAIPTSNPGLPPRFPPTTRPSTSQNPLYLSSMTRPKIQETRLTQPNLHIKTHQLSTPPHIAVEQSQANKHQLHGHFSTSQKPMLPQRCATLESSQTSQAKYPPEPRPCFFPDMDHHSHQGESTTTGWVQSPFNLKTAHVHIPTQYINSTSRSYV
jgi:hypothetical protein